MSDNVFVEVSAVDPTIINVVISEVASGGSGGLTSEQIQDLVASMVVAGSGITATYNDAAGTLTLVSTASGGLTTEQVQDAVAAMVVAGSGVTASYNDTAGTLTLTATGGGTNATNLSYTPSPTNGVVSSDTGFDATLPVATGTNAGLMAPADFTKLAGLSASTPTPVVLTDGSTIALDASLGRTFRITLAGNRTLLAPTNPTDGQVLEIEITQDGTGSRTLTLTGGSTGFIFGTDAPSSLFVLSTTPAKTDVLTAKYKAGKGWLIVSFIRGY